MDVSCIRMFNTGEGAVGWGANILKCTPPDKPSAVPPPAELRWLRQHCIIVYYVMLGTQTRLQCRMSLQHGQGLQK
jgi:hypothetical protein